MDDDEWDGRGNIAEGLKPKPVILDQPETVRRNGVLMSREIANRVEEEARREYERRYEQGFRWYSGTQAISTPQWTTGDEVKARLALAPRRGYGHKYRHSAQILRSKRTEIKEAMRTNPRHALNLIDEAIEEMQAEGMRGEAKCVAVYMNESPTTISHYRQSVLEPIGHRPLWGVGGEEE